MSKASDRLGSLIKAYLQENGLSERAFAKACGLSNVYIRNLKKGCDPKTGKPHEPTMETLQLLAKGMGVSIEELLEKLNYKVVDVEELDEEQRVTVVNMIKFFRQQKGGE